MTQAEISILETYFAEFLQNFQALGNIWTILLPLSN
jgi:hypothetical protein